MKKICCQVALFVFFSLEAGNVRGKPSTADAYLYFCQKAVSNDKIFDHFKRHPAYRVYVENLPYELGVYYLEILQKNYLDLLLECNRACQNDKLGNPFVYDYKPFGTFSPTTLSYLKITGDLRKKFGDLRKLHIVEICGGYGGLCAILAEYLGFASYTLVDFTECNNLSSKYLNRLNSKNVHHLALSQLDQIRHCDLLITSFSFSTIEKNGQFDSLQKLIANAPYGYMICDVATDLQHSSRTDLLFDSLLRDQREIELHEENPAQDLSHKVISWSPIKDSLF